MIPAYQNPAYQNYQEKENIIPKPNIRKPLNNLFDDAMVHGQKNHLIAGKKARGFCFTQTEYLSSCPLRSKGDLRINY